MRFLFAVATLTVTALVHAADAPAIKVGATLFADSTYIASPPATDADGNAIHSSSFNVSRAYLNVTGNLNERISFRITPDIARESGSSSLSGSQLFRLKYAFGQLTFAPGAWVRLGVQQTPLIDYQESIYRYRFQGPVFVEREGYLSSSDAGLSAHYDFSRNRGDVQAGIYNGEGYSKTEANDQKALQVRGTIRLPRGVRLTGFYDGDNYLRNAPRRRAVAEATFEGHRLNAGVDLIDAHDRTSRSAREVDGRGWSVWLTPKLRKGWELLLRHDDTKPDRDASVTRRRDIAGVAYWVPNLQKVTAAVMLDYDSLHVTARANDTRYGLKLLVSF